MISCASAADERNLPNPVGPPSCAVEAMLRSGPLHAAAETELTEAER